MKGTERARAPRMQRCLPRPTFQPITCLPGGRSVLGAAHLADESGAPRLARRECCLEDGRPGEGHSMGRRPLPHSQHALDRTQAHDPGGGMQSTGAQVINAEMEGRAPGLMHPRGHHTGSAAVDGPRVTNRAQEGGTQGAQDERSSLPLDACAAMRVGTQGGPRPFWDLAVVEVAASTWLWASGTGRPPSDRVAAGAGVMQALLTTRPPGQHAAGDAPLGLSDVGVMEPAGARRDGGSDLATVGRSHAPAPALHHSPRSGMITSERPLLSFAAHLVSRGAPLQRVLPPRTDRSRRPAVHAGNAPRRVLPFRVLALNPAVPAHRHQEDGAQEMNARGGGRVIQPSQHRHLPPRPPHSCMRARPGHPQFGLSAAAPERWMQCRWVLV